MTQHFKDLQEGSSFSSMQFKDENIKWDFFKSHLTSPQNGTLNIPASFFLFVIFTYYYIGAFNLTFTDKLFNEGRLC